MLEQAPHSLFAVNATLLVGPVALTQDSLDLLQRAVAAEVAGVGTHRLCSLKISEETWSDSWPGTASSTASAAGASSRRSSTNSSSSSTPSDNGGDAPKRCA